MTLGWALFILAGVAVLLALQYILVSRSIVGGITHFLARLFKRGEE